jgi:hypothetical protein
VEIRTSGVCIPNKAKIIEFFLKINYVRVTQMKTCTRTLRELIFQTAIVLWSYNKNDRGVTLKTREETY